MSAMLEDLARSGLTKKDALLMRLKEVSTAFIKKHSKKYSAEAYAIPYLDEARKTNGFSRYKFLSPVEDEETGKSIKYWQPPKSPPHAYFPPHVDWQKVKADVSIDIIITEGEKKAAAGAKFLKRPVIGLGGVWSWGSKKEKTPILPELIPYLKGRKVIVCFDHDPVPNPDVMGAMHKLAQTLRRNGADPWQLSLPELEPGAKAGLDDVLVALGPKGIEDLEPVPFGDVAALSSLNQELAFIEKSGAIYHLPTHSLYSDTRRLTTLIYADRSIVVYDAKGNPVEKNLAAEWLKWPQRRRHADLSYAPGQDLITNDGRLNVWPGWGIKPKRSDVSLFLEFINTLFKGAGKDTVKWFMQWLAYPLQHPGTKLYTSVVLYSRHQGVGKSLLGETIGRIYGDNYVAIDAATLHGSFNSWARHKQFILGDEITGREKKEDAERLKILMTQEKVTINVKYQVPYTLPDCINYLLTTNHPDAISLDLHDRRFFVWEIREKTFDDLWFEKYNVWYRTDAGAAAIFEYLLRVDLKGFNPRAKAPVTEAKLDMQSIADTPIDFLVRELIAVPDKYLLGSKRDLYMASEVAALIDPMNRYHAVSVAKALRRCGIREGEVTRTKRGIVKLYAVRNQDRWLKADHGMRQRHYDGE